MLTRRLTDKGIKIGLIGDHRKEIYLDKSEKIKKINSIMTKSSISPSKAEKIWNKNCKRWNI
jgi:tRNA uridine 5-carboxymethylaminomethyl modification enzyme